MEENHYTYRIEDPVTGEFYIGSRSCKCDPEEDVYMGSYCNWTPEDPERLEKTILKNDYKNRKEAYFDEFLIIKAHQNFKKNKNKSLPLPFGSFSSLGMKFPKQSKRMKECTGENALNRREVIDVLTGKKYPTCLSASVDNQCSITTISYQASGKLYKQRFVYIDELPEDPKLRNSRLKQLKDNYINYQNPYSGSKNHSSIKVRHIETGKTFETMTEAGKYVGLTRHSISNHCNNKVKNPKFEFVK